MILTSDRNWKETVIKNFHLASLSSISLGRDTHLSEQLNNMAMATGELLFQILNPLLFPGLMAVARLERDRLHDICLSISRVATMLNAQFSARRQTNHITFIWPYPGQTFDDKCDSLSDESGSSTGEARRVKIARFWGIKMRDNDSGHVRILAKSVCAVF